MKVQNITPNYVNNNQNNCKNQPAFGATAVVSKAVLNVVKKDHHITEDFIWLLEQIVGLGFRNQPEKTEILLTLAKRVKGFTPRLNMQARFDGKYLGAKLQNTLDSGYYRDIERSIEASIKSIPNQPAFRKIREAERLEKLNEAIAMTKSK